VNVPVSVWMDRAVTDISIAFLRSGQKQVRALPSFRAFILVTG